jgi:hypothetical protein
MIGELGMMLMLAAGGAHDSARPTAQRYLDAIAAGDAAEICHLLSPSARRELRADGMKRTCVAAAREYPRALGKFPVVKIKFEGHIASVTIGDHETSDSGDDVFRMSHATGRWLVLDP